ncbi:MAG: hypothetical protein PHN35_04045 [Clostridia bacterium]|nr:hypothetical protein [Clostridia bacterium]
MRGNNMRLPTPGQSLYSLAEITVKLFGLVLLHQPFAVRRIGHNPTRRLGAAPCSLQVGPLHFERGCAVTRYQRLSHRANAWFVACPFLYDTEKSATRCP